MTLSGVEFWDQYFRHLRESGTDLDWGGRWLEPFLAPLREVRARTNALMENFWSTLKIELVYRNSWRTRDEAENALFAYIDGWYNTRRIQARLGDLSPDEYETAWYTANIDQPKSPGTTLEPAGAR